MYSEVTPLTIKLVYALHRCSPSPERSTDPTTKKAATCIGHCHPVLVGQPWSEQRKQNHPIRAHRQRPSGRGMPRKSQRPLRELGAGSGKHTHNDSFPAVQAEIDLSSFSCGECHRRKQKVRLPMIRLRRVANGLSV